MQLVRDLELETLLPKPSLAVQKELESQLLADGGPREPIRVWKGRGIIVDGYRRHDICTRLSLPFKTEEIDFPDKDAVKIWMLRFQYGRRNLNQHQETLVLAALSDLYKKSKTANGSTENVASKVAKEAGVTKRTVHRAVAYAEALKRLPDYIRDRIKDLQPAREDVVALSKLTDEEIRGIWADYDTGQYSSLRAAIHGEPEEYLEDCDEDEIEDDSSLRSTAKNTVAISGSDREDPGVPSPLEPRGDSLSPLKASSPKSGHSQDRLFNDVYQKLGALKKAVDNLSIVAPGPHFQRVIDHLNKASDAVTDWKHDEDM